MLLGAAGLVIALTLLFTRTSVGLRMRAAAFNPTAARLSGVRVSRMLALGWALAGVVGAIAGVLIAQGRLHFAPTWAVASLGSIAGITLSYALGRTVGLATLARAEGAMHGALTVKHAQGRLLGPLDVSGMHYDDGNGTVLARWEVAPSHGMGIDGKGNIYVALTQLHRIDKYVRA